MSVGLSRTFFLQNQRCLLDSLQWQPHYANSYGEDSATAASTIRLDSPFILQGLLMASHFILINDLDSRVTAHQADRGGH